MTNKSTQNRLRVAATKATPAPVATPALPASLVQINEDAKAAPAPEPVKAAPPAPAPAPEQPAPAPASAAKPKVKPATPTPNPDPDESPTIPASAPAAKAKPAPTKKFADINVKECSVQVITVLTRNPDGSIKNPKVASGAPAKRFAKYADGMTVAQALAAGVTDGDIRWDVAHEYITLA